MSSESGIDTSSPGHTQVVLLRSAREDDPYEDAFRQAGFTVRCQPVLAFDQVNTAQLREKMVHPDHYAGLILTSPRAVEALEQVLGRLPERRASSWHHKSAFAVGPRTAETLQALGFSPKGQQSGSGRKLAAYINQHTFEAPLLFLCGSRRREELPALLKNGGTAYEELCVYKTRLRTDVDVTRPSVPEWLVFFSPSGVNALQRSGGEALHERVRIAAIGPTTASAAREAGWSVDAVADRPAPDALCQAVQTASRLT